MSNREILEKIIEKQKEFQEAVDIPINSLSDVDRNKMTETYLFLAIKEIIELSREFPSVANPWSKHNKISNIDRVREEFSDVLMFLINVAIVWKISPSEMLEQLVKTQENNFNKLKSKKMDMLNADILKIPNVVSGIGSGNLSPKYIFIGQNPGKSITQGYKFWSDENDGSSKILLPILDKLGIRNESYFTNLVKCTTPENSEPTDEQLRFYGDILWKELNILRIQSGKSKIIAVGKWATEKLPMLGIIPDFSIFHPSYVLRGGMNNEEYFNYIKESLNL